MNFGKYFIIENITIPNILSVIRILLVPVILYCFMYGDQFMVNYIAIPLVLIAIFTDFLDGYLARKLNQVTELGKILDPVADKIAITAIALYLFFRHDFPFWLILLIIIRDLLIIIGATLIIERKELVLPSNSFGKWTTGSIFLLFVVYIFNLSAFKFPLEIISALLILVSFFSYLKNFLSIYSNK